MQAVLVYAQMELTQQQFVPNADERERKMQAIRKDLSRKLNIIRSIDLEGLPMRR